jgi:CRISPR system Cascade subunit CasD
MLDVLLLRLDAPWMSFGGEVVDKFGVTRDFPGRAMLTGLIGNALGYDHAEPASLDALQRRLRYAVRQDRAGVAMIDYQTVDLGQDFMRHPGWTTRGVPEEREGSKSSQGTHIRHRHYLADAIYTVALTLGGDGNPSLDGVERALRSPERPLFLGRKNCLPAAPLVLGRAAAARLRDALEATPPIARARRRDDGSSVRAWWPVDEGADSGRTLAITDDMDWTNQIHVGRRFMQESMLTITSEASHVG